MRLIIDKLGNGHHDLFLKIDILPAYSQSADSYYLSDFLEITGSEDNLKYIATEFLKYWKARIESIRIGESKFIPFDLSDEYLGGLMIKKTKIGYKITIVHTRNIHGYGVTVSNIDEQIKDKNIQFEASENQEWVISEEVIFQGLDWSLSEIS